VKGWVSVASLLVALGCAGASETPARRVIVPGVGRLPAFAHATVTRELIFVSGALGTKPGSVEMVEGGVAAQTTQALHNIEEILAAEGATRVHLAQCTVFLADMADYAAMNEAWIPFFAGDPPARATVAVAGLALGAALEVSCVAQRPAAR
jgi:reactive intermediate/imine deaminase